MRATIMYEAGDVRVEDVPDAGIVEFAHKAFNQKGELVAECRRQAMMRKRPKA